MLLTAKSKKISISKEHLFEFLKLKQQLQFAVEWIKMYLSELTTRLNLKLETGICRLKKRDNIGAI